MISTVIRTCFPAAALAVADKAEEINKLNVFPVPDGDTGTNMSLTLGTVVREVQDLPADASMEDIAKAITHGSLMGARGNSGVITSQILRGVVEGLCDVKDPEHIKPKDIAHAFRRGKEVAFKAVRKPVEGTILTVLKVVSAKADSLEKSKLTPVEVLDALVVEAYESVARTPDLLPVLKENGVVDSGAFGFATFFEGFVNAVQGKTELSDFKTTVGTDDAKAAASAKVSIELNDDWEGSEFRYCNEFLFHANDATFDESAALDFLSTMGDCELLVGTNPDYKVHVHSNTPDKVLHYMLQYGQIFEVFIHNMDLEAKERTEKIAEDKKAASTPKAPHKSLGFVAVCSGSGSESILKSLGVDVVVSGGQTMNPSTADILSAIEEANADSVIVMPNNSNIRMAAEAAASACTDVKVAVIPTKSVLQAFSAMFVVDAEASLKDNVAAMTEASANIRYAEITTAVRDSTAANGDPIHNGDVMGIQGSSIDVVGHDVDDVTLRLLSQMQEEEEGDTLTLLAGSDMDDAHFSALTKRIEEAFPDLEVDAHRGEQPLYPIIFSLE